MQNKKFFFENIVYDSEISNGIPVIINMFHHRITSLADYRYFFY